MRSASRIVRVSLLWISTLWLMPMICAAGTCHHGYIAEGQLPPAFEGIATTDAGFTVRLWAWGTNPSSSGTAPIGLVDTATGVAISPGFLWASSDACSGELDGVGVLVEAMSADDGGHFALVAVAEAEAQVDRIQETTGSSVATPIPRPRADWLASGTDGYGDYADVLLFWAAPESDAWSLSTAPSVLAGYAVYFNTASTGGPVQTGDTTSFTRVTAAATSSAPHVVDDPDTQDGLLPASAASCVVRIRPSEVYYFALALIFDGSGAAGGDPQVDASAIQSLYVSASSNPISTEMGIFSDGFESGSTSAWSDVVG